MAKVGISCWTGNRGPSIVPRNISSVFKEDTFRDGGKTYSLFPLVHHPVFQLVLFYIQKTSAGNPGKGCEDSWGTAGTLGIVWRKTRVLQHLHCHFHHICGHEPFCLWLILGPSKCFYIPQSSWPDTFAAAAMLVSGRPSKSPG